MKKIRKGTIVLFCVLLLVVSAVIAAVRYLSFTMPADEKAEAAMEQTERVSVEETETTIIFTPKEVLPSTGVIYYPGGRVEPESFAYAAREIASEGYLVIIQKMPFNLAVLGKNRGYQLTKQYNSIENWYLSGFSLGGISACMSLSKEEEPFCGLILYASYTTAEYDLSDSGLRVLSITGSKDGLSSVGKIESSKQYLPSDTSYYEVEGGNHTQFAIYGNGELQKGDYDATVSRMEQQDIMIAETLKFLNQ